MGRASKWKEFADDQRLTADDAQPVGRTPAGVEVTYPSATLITYDAGSRPTLIYTDEVPLTQTKIRRIVEYQREEINLQTKYAYLIKDRHEWEREEYSIDRLDKKEAGISAGYHLVRAKWPYATYSVNYASFKTAYLGSKPEFVLVNSTQPWKRSALDKEYVNSKYNLEERIENLSYDYWADGSQLVAGNFISNFSTDAAGKIINWQKAEWSLGICKNFEEYHHELRFSDEVKTLLSDTEARRIPFVNTKAGFQHKLWPETVVQCEAIMDIVIAQALAGLDKENKEEEKFRGRPVIERIVWLYKDSLDRYNKRVSEKYGGEKRAAVEEEHFLKDSQRNAPFKH